MTIALFDANEVVHKFEHEVELDFGGNRDYSYSQVIAPNDYQSLTGNFELYGVDAGYPSGWDLNFLNHTLKQLGQVVEIINEEILNLLEHSDILEVDTNYDTVNVTVENPEGEIMQDFSIDIETDIEIEVAEIETPTIEEPVVEEIEIEVQEVAVEIEEVEVEETVAEEQPTRKKQKVVAQAKQKVANKIVKNMGDKGKYDSTNQLKTLVVMQVLGNTTSFFENQKQLQDTPNFFTDAKIPDSSLSDNNYTQYILFGVSNTTHET